MIYKNKIVRARSGDPESSLSASWDNPSSLDHSITEYFFFTHLFYSLSVYMLTISYKSLALFHSTPSSCLPPLTSPDNWPLAEPGSARGFFLPTVAKELKWGHMILAVFSVLIVLF